MDAFVRKVILLAACGLLAAATAMATIPNASTSTCPGCGGPGSTPPFINVVGFTNPALVAFGPSAPAHAGTAVTITIRDFAGNAVENAEVALDIGGCGGLKLCTVIPSGAASQSVGCPDVVRGTTNSLGLVTLQIVGAGTGVGSGPNPGCAQLVVTPPGGGAAILLANLTTVTYDANGASGTGGANGVSALDLGLVRADLKDQQPPLVGTNTYHSRSDYSSVDGCSMTFDCGAPMTAIDISYFRGILRQSTVPPLTGSGGGCPDQSAPLGPDYCP